LKNTHKYSQEDIGKLGMGFSRELVKGVTLSMQFIAWLSPQGEENAYRRFMIFQAIHPLPKGGGFLAEMC